RDEPGADEGPSPVSLVTDRYYQRLGRTTTYVRDPSHEITINDLLKGSSAVRFQRNDSHYLSFGLTTDAFWLKVRIQRPEQDSRPYLIELQNSMLESIDFYHVRENRILESIHIERTTPPDARPFHHPNYIIPLRLKAGESGTFYIRVLSREAVNIPLFLWSQTDFNRVDRYRQFAYGLFYGLMLVMALYNFFIFLSVKDRAYLYYVLYILSFTLFFSLLHGYLFFFLYSLNFETLYGFAPATALLTSLCSMLFARKFFLLKEEFTRAYRAVTTLIVLHALAIPFSMLMHGVIPGIIGNILPMIAVVLLVVIAVVRMLSGFEPARYFLLAWSFLIAGVVIFVLQNLGLVAANFFTNNVAMIGAGLETILLSFALGFRINSLMRAEEDARQGLIREQQNKLEHEKRMSRSFARFVPREFLNYLNKDSILQIERGEAVQKEMTVMFTDIRGFTTLAEKMGSESIFRLLNSYFE
ncbi:MAG: hypothetical protein KDK34_09885, partial [Leptospiraceae bacterium]|nr:hypothetical protein [Leptospiraceae bacterium]